MNVKFRKAELRDWEGIFPLLEQMGKVGSKEVCRAIFEHVVNQPEHSIVIAEVKQDLLGYAHAQSYGPHLRTGNTTARLNDLFVLPSYRKQGIAKGLLESVIIWAKHHNVKYLQWQANKSSAAFYEKLGHVAIPDPDSEHPFFEIEFS